MTNGRVASGIGYQSARGIVFEADQMMDDVSGRLSARNREAMQAVRGIMIHFKDAFAPLSAPKEPRADPKIVRELIARAEAMARTVE